MACQPPQLRFTDFGMGGGWTHKARRAHHFAAYYCPEELFASEQTLGCALRAAAQLNTLNGTLTEKVMILGDRPRSTVDMI